MQDQITLPKQIVDDMGYSLVIFSQIIAELTIKYPLLILPYGEKINYLDKTISQLNEQIQNLKK